MAPHASSPRPDHTSGVKDTSGEFVIFRNATPGPGAYLAVELFGKETPAWTIAGRNGPDFYGATERSRSAAAEAPGPSAPTVTAFGSQSPTRPKSPQYSFPHEPRHVAELPSSTVPGPGQYPPSQVSPRGGMKFGSSPRAEDDKHKLPYMGEDAAERTNKGRHSPGPGLYNPRTDIGDAPRFSMASRASPGRSRDDVPGPGKYDGVGPKAANTGCKFGTALQRLDVEKNPKKMLYLGKEFDSGMAGVHSPGPGKYNPPMPPSRGGVAFGSGARDRAPRPELVHPGPGSYPNASGPALGRTGPAFSAGRAPQRPSLTLAAKNEQRPGAGTAALEQFAKLQPRQPVYSLAKGPRFDDIKPLAPGPGQYAARQAWAGPAARIGSEPQRLRPETDHKKVPYWGDEFATANRGIHSPGPGAYAPSRGSVGEGAPRFGFGTGPNRVLPSPTASPTSGLPSSRGGTSPGPGKYDLKGTVGKGRDGTLPSSEAYGFGTALQRVRPQTEPKKAVYLGKEFESDALGAFSPGPFAYNPPMPPSTSPKYSFDKARRFT